MKKCTMCKEIRPHADFAKASSTYDGLQRGCKKCKAAQYQKYSDKYRAANKQRMKLHRDTTKLKIKKIFEDSDGCVDCGMTDIRVLEFDHVRDEKKMGVMQMVASMHAWESILEEIKKCEIRCRNCHSIATYERLGIGWRI